MVRTTKSKKPTKSREELIESQISAIVISGEYDIAKRNADSDMGDFESYIDLLECNRTDRSYDWMSDIFLPEFPSHIITQSAIDANQYFQTRDYVDVYLQEGGEANVLKADAAKECINRTLNQKHIYFYQKFMRAKVINQLGGQVYARCWWEKKYVPITTYQNQMEQLPIDVEGNPMIDPSIQVPATRMVSVPVESEQVIVDRFNFDIIDPRNVFTENTYTYSAQQKEWIIVRFEQSYDELKKEEVNMGYINLDKLKKIKPPDKTDTSKSSYNKDIDAERYQKATYKPFDIIERHGGFWVKVKDRDEQGNPLSIDPGYDEYGKQLDDAEYIETVIAFAMSDSSSTLIRFQPNFYKDYNFQPYKPIIRGLNYIHPTKDGGLGDGKYSKELQIAINDTFNVSCDRIMLATMPTLKGKKFALEDNTTIRFEPGHTIMLENPDDLVEFKITDNVAGALNQIAMLTSGMDKSMGVYPPQMGQLPAVASTTATAFAGTQNTGNVRSNYKSMTFEHTFLSELFCQILLMTAQFAESDTGSKLMGQKVYNFDPSAEYIYKPVSASIEMEANKNIKKQSIIQLISFVAQMQNPKTATLVNKLLSMYFKLSGDEYEEFASAMLDESAPVAAQAGTPEAGGQPMSNQNGVPQSEEEQMARQGMEGMGG